VCERLITAQELFDAADSGKLEEAFGSGTAAVVSPIGEMRWENRVAVINGGNIGHLTKRLYDTITGIQWGTEPDPYGWTVRL
jgi:branched-chain amino acid aminotransferase